MDEADLPSDLPELPELTLEQDEFAHIIHYLPSPESAAGPPRRLSGTKHTLPSTPVVNQSPIGITDADRDDKKRQRRFAWTHTEDVSILAMHRQYGNQWDLIAAQLPGRTADAVRNHCFRLLKQHPMSTSEEGRHALDGLVLATHGVALPETLAHGKAEAAEPPPKPPRHSQSSWTTEEDRIIEKGVAQLGCKWREIAKLLSGRSDSSVRNRWERLQRDKYASRPAKTPAGETADPCATAPPQAIPKVTEPSAEKPLGHAAPGVMVDLSEFSTVALNAVAEHTDPDVLSEASCKSILEDIHEDPMGYLGEGRRRKLQGAFLTAFAALSIGAFSVMSRSKN